MNDQPDEGKVATDDPKQSAAEAAPNVKITVQQHSMILYWWPIWVLGFLSAALSFFLGDKITVAGQTMWFYPSRNLGVIFLAVWSVIFLITNITIRGLGAVIAALGTLVLVLACSLLGVWDRLFSMEQHLSIHMDAGFYLFTAIIVFVSWWLSVFVFDRFTHCEFRPGQLVVRNLIGGGSRTFDTRGMAFYKLQDDPLRHWLLGMGTGDLHIATTGAESITLDVRNVAFIDHKLDRIKELVAMTPDNLGEGDSSKSP